MTCNNLRDVQQGSAEYSNFGCRSDTYGTSFQILPVLPRKALLVLVST